MREQQTNETKWATTIKTGRTTQQCVHNSLEQRKEGEKEAVVKTGKRWTRKIECNVLLDTVCVCACVHACFCSLLLLLFTLFSIFFSLFFFLQILKWSKYDECKSDVAHVEY